MSIIKQKIKVILKRNKKIKTVFKTMFSALRFLIKLIKNLKFNTTRILHFHNIKVRKMLAVNKIIKLHLGSGTNYFAGWINIDNNSDNNIEKIDLHWDLRYKLPFPDNSVDFIYNEHFLEHLTVEEGLKTLKDLRRILKATGIMRIAMPDLEEIVKTYLNSNWKSDNSEFFLKFGMSHIETKAELINANFHWWGHKHLYDFEELERRLKEVGFKTISRCKIYESDYAELKNLETRKESTLIAEIAK